jgi:hypothetical protein
MATIGRAGNRIITKVVNGERRVSCSCCPSDVECCPYPAQGLIDELYTAADLPDELKTVVNVFGGLGVISKDGNVYRYTFTSDDGPIAAIIRVNPDIIFDLGAGWENVIEDTGSEIGLPCACLFGVCSDFGVEDNFADTYTVYVNGIADVFDQTFSVVRRSLCVWSSDVDEGEPSGVILTPPQSFSPKWVLLVGGDAQAKDDPQNSPIGLYGDQGTEISE